METFTIYDQKMPFQQGKEYVANLVVVLKKDFNNAEEAMKFAKEKRLSRWPVVWSQSMERLRERPSRNAF